ncbi:uncharacterized protein V2V93DRAFT_376139 [Kockiozyma suomiensis]|uniref:uncharacterized protein n=1 Tax=Kockiozyma suomiensis TaxID=1337062 RepID=UPI003343F375
MSDVESNSYWSLKQGSGSRATSSASTTSSNSSSRPPLPPVVTAPRAIEHYEPANRDPENSVAKLYLDDDDYAAAASTSASASPTAIGDKEKALQLKKEAKMMQDGLAAILERINAVKGDYERLEGENKFLQDYIGSLMSTSKMLASRSSD